MLLAKEAYCDRPDGVPLLQQENATAEALTRPRGRPASTRCIQAPVARLPLGQITLDGGCLLMLYPWANQSLEVWLENHPDRCLTQVLRVTAELLRLLACLHQQGATYVDLKPSNLLVLEDPEPLTLQIGDLGGFACYDRAGRDPITTTPGDTPEFMSRSLGSADTLENLASALLGEVLLAVLTGPAAQGAMAELRQCIATANRPEALETCAQDALRRLRPLLAPGLQPKGHFSRSLSDLCAVMLLLLGLTPRGLTFTWRMASQLLGLGSTGAVQALPA